jgi:hypothetical protein
VVGKPESAETAAGDSFFCSSYNSSPNDCHFLPGTPRLHAGKVAFLRDFVENGWMSSRKSTMSPLLAVALLCVAIGCESKPNATKSVPTEAPAPKRGNMNEGGGCRVTDDCAVGLACADDKTCQSLKTIECRAREDVCGEEGRCLGKNGKCVPASADACKHSRRCETDGRCTLKDDKCAAVSPDDCATLCKAMGRCTIEDGTCIAGSSKDCQQSEACKQSKRCRAYAGRCAGR